MTYYRRQRMESFKRAMFADHLDRALVTEDDSKTEESTGQAWWKMPFDQVMMEPGKLAS
jgi:hypothetical protein